MFYHFRLSDKNGFYSDEPVVKSYNCDFTNNHLTAVDGIRIILEQCIYIDYLSNVLENDFLIQESKARLLNHLDIFHRRVTDKFLKHYMDVAVAYSRAILNGRIEDATTKYAVTELFNVFSCTPTGKYYNREYVPTISEEFLTIWINIATGYAFAEKYPTSIIYGAPIYVPSVKVEKRYDPTLADEANDKYLIAITLVPVKYRDQNKTLLTLEYNLRSVNVNGERGILNLLRRYKFDRLPASELFAIVSNFYIGGDRYIMKNSTNVFIEACYSLLNTISYKHSDMAILESIKSLFSKYISEYSIVPDDMFIGLLYSLSADPQLISALTKPIESRTIGEVECLRKDTLSVMEHRSPSIPSLEALDDPTDPRESQADDEKDTEDETGDDDTGEEPDTEEGKEDDTDESTTDVDDIPDEPEPEEPKDTPKEDDFMLLEIQDQALTMSDWAFRSIMAKRITEIINNPPLNLASNDLLLIKRWKTRFLYLVSKKSLVDFMARFAGRIS